MEIMRLKFVGRTDGTVFDGFWLFLGLEKKEREGSTGDDSTYLFSLLHFFDNSFNFDGNRI